VEFKSKIMGLKFMSEIDIKTCTVTVFSKNYGAFLQAWALQQFLGEQNFLLRIEKRFDLHLYVGTRGKKLLPFFWRLIAFWRYLFRNKKLFDELNTLKCSRIHYSQKYVIENPPVAEVYIAGSDQIWNSEWFINYKRPWKIYFLGFGTSNAKRIAYAVSMGAKEWPAAFAQKVLPYLKKFHAISVREESSVPFLNSIGLKNVAATCDPTILHTADFYRSHFHYAENKCSGCIFIYSLNIIKFSLPMQRFLVGKKAISFIPNKSRKYLSIAQWLHNIEKAESVITDSFHGTVFSILFHKPFFSLLTFSIKYPRNERIISLLKKVNLEYRLLNGNETKEEIEEILYRPVDWLQVDKILEEWRAYSANWLRDALESENVQTEV